jgi:adenosylmethionine-8-amino-7-oxononanoate aminotransferase
MPPLTVTEDEIGILVDVTSRAMDSVFKEI